MHFSRSSSLAVLLSALVCVAPSCKTATDDDDDTGANTGGGTSSSTSVQASSASSGSSGNASGQQPGSSSSWVRPSSSSVEATVAPGGACSCDQECKGSAENPGRCVYGICMAAATQACTAEGSTAECPAGHRCWAMDRDPICWPDCAGITCAGRCDSDGSCAPTNQSNCDRTCGVHCTEVPATTHPSGGGCVCDGDCEGNFEHPAVCVFGVCMTRPNGPCASEGSTAECPAGQVCRNFPETTIPLCWASCDRASCAGACDAQGVCTPTSDMRCDPFCGGLCETRSLYSCSTLQPNGTCPPTYVCQDGSCVSERGCADWRCTEADCQELMAMPGSYSPYSVEARAKGYFISTDPHYTYVRKDVFKVIEYALCEVQRKFPNTPPLALADAAQADGEVPGVDVGQPRHPPECHHGESVDTAYFQTDGANDYQIICGDGSDTNGNGQAGQYNDGEFCTTEQNIVDWEKEMVFWSRIAESPGILYLGIDQTLADEFQQGADAMFDRGEITETIRDRMKSVLGYGPRWGWQYHHHHTHIEFAGPTTPPPLPPPNQSVWPRF